MLSTTAVRFPAEHLFTPIGVIDLRRMKESLIFSAAERQVMKIGTAMRFTAAMPRWAQKALRRSPVRVSGDGCRQKSELALLDRCGTRA